MSFLRALLVVALLILPVGVSAQGIPQQERVSVILSPEYPRPYDVVNVTPRSTLIDLGASKVTISVNGTVVEEDSGTRTVQIRMGGPGSVSVLRVSVAGPYGETAVKEITLRPADVALVLEPMTTAHPFYEGGKLVAPEGRVRVVAIPDFRGANGAMISPQNLVYTWKNGEQVLQQHSGIGRSVLDATAPTRYRDARITVTVSTQDRTYVASGAVTVAASEPIVRAYRMNPLLGILFERAISGTVAMDGDEDTFHAVPYFYASEPAVEWAVNGTGGKYQRDLTVRITEAGEGTARIGVAAYGSGVQESAEHAFNLSYRSSSAGGIFGL